MNYFPKSLRDGLAETKIEEEKYVITGVIIH